MLLHNLTLSSLLCFLLMLLIAPTHALPSARKLDEAPSGDSTVKCSPCDQNPPSPPPPPPPLYPSPPPPSPPPPDVIPYYSPPPPKKEPKNNDCPPPPPSPPSFMYITGPPGDLYPIDQNYIGAARRVAAGLSALIGFGLVGLLAT